jgi:hypothetical protein
MRVHKEVWAKVNVLVDEGILDLVTALSEINTLQTIESCQGHSPEALAFVTFKMTSWQECGRFLFDRLLAAMDPNLRADVSVSIVGYDSDHCHGRIAMPPAAVDPVVRMVRSVRNSAYSHDTKRT